MNRAFHRRIRSARLAQETSRSVRAADPKNASSWEGQMSRMRSLSAFFILAAALALHDSAYASPVTYTLSITETSGGATVVGPENAVSSLSFASGTGTFSEVINSLSPLIFDHVASGTLLFRIDFEAFDHASA